jgi:hypothetical protein
MKNITLVATLGLIIFVVAVFIHPYKTTETFFNVIPTNVIDPEFIDLNNENAAFASRGSLASAALYHISGQSNPDCSGVTPCNIVSWIANDYPLGNRMLNELVLRFDPSADPMNPNHATRILRLLFMHLPSYACSTTAKKYLPIIQKCYPMLTQVA